MVKLYISIPNYNWSYYLSKGLCGTFNSNQMDDFLTPEGDIEQNVVAFANKWKTKEKCPDVTQNHNHPCDSNIQNKEEALKYCKKLKEELFAGIIFLLICRII